ncbi:MAG: hypothetical protein V2A62_02580 [Candidatus Woesearchaeota archaeon]
MTRLTNLVLSAVMGLSVLGCKNGPITFDNPVLHESHRHSGIYEIYTCKEGEMIPAILGYNVEKEKLEIKYDHEDRWTRPSLELEFVNHEFKGTLHLRPEEKVPIYIPPTPEPNHFPYNLEYRGVRLPTPSYMPDAKCPDWQWKDEVGYLPTGKFNPVPIHYYKGEEK